MNQAAPPKTPRVIVPDDRPLRPMFPLLALWAVPVHVVWARSPMSKVENVGYQGWFPRMAG